jgi:hypothetical protein
MPKHPLFLTVLSKALSPKSRLGHLIAKTRCGSRSRGKNPGAGQPMFTPLPKLAFWSTRKLLGWGSRKTRGIRPPKSREQGEPNGVCYELGGNFETRGPRGANGLPAHHATQTLFFLNPASGSDIPGTYLAFFMSGQVINYVVVVW